YLEVSDEITHRLHRSYGVEPTPENDLAIFADTEVQLREYFAGERRRFDLPLATPGTEFQRSVWHALTLIPYVGTAGYGELAEALGRPGAARAVGAANAKNPICIVVPCHRVIGADGSLTGYAWGEAKKRHLLDLEQGRGDCLSRRTVPWRSSDSPSSPPRPGRRSRADDPASRRARGRNRPRSSQ